MLVSHEIVALDRSVPKGTTFVASPLRQGERIEVRGFGHFEYTLTLPLSLEGRGDVFLRSLFYLLPGKTNLKSERV
jgi:hypothetical protein